MSIGKRLPDSIWNVPLTTLDRSGAMQTLRLRDVRGRVILLDFLSTGCLSCIAALPKLDGLQQVFSNSLAVLPITSEKIERLSRFKRDNKYTKGLTLPIIVEDSLLNNYFPHQYISHVVWIDTAGVVRATTGTNQVTERTIKEFMSGEPLNWPMKTENTSFFGEPLIVSNPKASELPNNRNRLIYYSAVTEYTEGAGTYHTSAKDSLMGVDRVSYRNRSILDLFRIAVGGKFSNNVILEVSDPSRYTVTKRGIGIQTMEEWQQQNAMCYEATFPLTMPRDKRNEYMLADLNRFLNLNGRLEKRDTTCLVLIRGLDSVDIRYQGDAIGRVNSTGLDTAVWELKGYSLQSLVSALNAEDRFPLFIDETNYKSPVDIRLKVTDLRDIKSLQAALKPYGLELKEKRRKIEFFVLTELYSPTG